MIDLKKLAGRKYKTVLDESYEPTGCLEDRLWHIQIPAKYGHVYLHGANLLGAYTDGRKRIAMMKAIPGLRLHQNGDKEASFVFPPELLDQVAAVLKARKGRPPMSEEQKAAAVERLARFSFRPTRSPDADSAA